MVNLRLSLFEVFNSNFSKINVLSQFSLPENIVLLYSKVFFYLHFKFLRKFHILIVGCQSAGGRLSDCR